MGLTFYFVKTMVARLHILMPRRAFCFFNIQEWRFIRETKI